MARFRIEGHLQSEMQADVRHCLELARITEGEMAAGERLASARSAVNLARAYDRVLEDIRRVSLPLEEQRRIMSQLAPVAQLLRKYRLR